MSEQNHSVPDAQHSVPDSQETSTSFWRKPAVAGVAAGLGVLLVAAAVTGIVFAVAGDDTTENAASEVSSSAAPGGDNVDDAPAAPETSPSEAPVDAFAPSDAASLEDAISAAVTAVGGAGATQIEVQRNGWEVEVQRANGTEVEVFVAIDGSTSLRDEDDDTSDEPLIDVGQLPNLVRNALDAAGGGTIEQISTDDDDEYYEVEVRMEDGSDAEVTLDAALKVLDVDLD